MYHPEFASVIRFNSYQVFGKYNYMVIMDFIKKGTDIEDC